MLRTAPCTCPDLHTSLFLFFPGHSHSLSLVRHWQRAAADWSPPPLIIYPLFGFRLRLGLGLEVPAFLNQTQRGSTPQDSGARPCASWPTQSLAEKTTSRPPRSPAVAVHPPICHNTCVTQMIWMEIMMEITSAWKSFIHSLH